jgi:D-beta-D-heptose 7-phosphate kinase/D-beta-D-heptose 1-phosphate adenosyltransferase
MKRMLVIGDGCLDVFVYGKCTRLNPEAPTPVFVPSYSTTNYGMAGNVFENLAGIKNTSVDFVTNEEITPTKTRYVDEKSNYIMMRVDENDKIPQIEKNRINSIKFEDYDCVLVSDYDKGFLSTEDIETIGSRSKISFIDTKKPLGPWCHTLTWIKMNESESMNPKHNQNTLELVKEKLIITLGERGAKIGDTIIPGERVEVMDVVGAGDTFLAALAHFYLQSNDIYGSIGFANVYSAKSVRKRGVAKLVDLLA